MRGLGGHFVFLHRGMAKAEFMPFLSDTDITVITDGQASKLRVKAHLQRLQKNLPILESLSPVLTLKEFEPWSDPEAFADRLSFLYRLVEARNTWTPFYEDGTQSPLERIRPLDRVETLATMRSEILF